MKWITREKVKVDRVACPWLIKKFIDPDAEFLFIPADKALPIAEEQKAIAYDIPGVKYAHHDGRCSFEALITGYKLTDPALLLLAKIVHGADVINDLHGQPEAYGLLAVAQGFSMLGLSDHEILQREFVVYDALYEYCKNRVATNKS